MQGPSEGLCTHGPWELTCKKLCSSGFVPMAREHPWAMSIFAVGSRGSLPGFTSSLVWFAALADGLSQSLFWLPAWWDFGLSGDHDEQNIQCVLIDRCCLPMHVWSTLLSVGNKVTTTTIVYSKYPNKVISLSDNLCSDANYLNILCIFSSHVEIMCLPRTDTLDELVSLWTMQLVQIMV